MKRSFDRRLEVLDDVFEFLRAFVENYDISNEDAFAIQLAAEELFTNLIKYNKHERNKILIDLERLGKKIVLTFIDSTDHPFDLNSAQPYDTKQRLDRRPVGKIGIHLIHKYIDDIEQEYQNKKNTIRLIKNLRQ
jgi:anti-sigma regulatory factor (Ser/Thr protein kinase)